MPRMCQIQTVGLNDLVGGDVALMGWEER
jgi:hypothetical protein